MKLNEILIQQDGKLRPAPEHLCAVAENSRSSSKTPERWMLRGQELGAKGWDTCQVCALSLREFEMPVLVLLP